MNEAKITYLYHSGFAVETPQHFLVFDYYRASADTPAPGLSEGVIDIEALPEDKKIYVFVSHSHGDHFNPVIFEWSKKRTVTYILSDDVNADPHNMANTIVMGAYELVDLDQVIVKTFGSTDKGLSFLVKVDGVSIFHSGDLNWWHWKAFNSDELLREEKDFKRELDRVIGEDIDIAFVPVDPRLEEFAFLAGEYFVEKLRPKLFIPMHFADKPEISQKFAHRIEDFPTSAVVIKNRGQLIKFNK